MSKDEFKKRLIDNFPTPKKRRELYVKIHNAMFPYTKKMMDSRLKTIMSDYDNKSESEQLTRIHERIYKISKQLNDIPRMIHPAYTLILVDFVKSDKHLSKLLKNTGLDKL